mmetsp:Transcript_4361/g.13792  ORF Transcript_4361/g.13792 Transcript_4361/m.13792 type:complete len:1663 (-) Transcript_4361:3703-8691(-)
MDFEATRTCPTFLSPSNRPQCVDESTEIYQVLLALLVFIHESMTAQPFVHSQCHERTYMLLACLRILKTNIRFFLLDIHYADILRKAISLYNSAPPAGSIGLFHISQPYISLYTEYCSNHPNLEIGDSLARAFCCLQHQIALLFHMTTQLQAEIAAVIKGEAARVLLAGLELFYPCQQTQAQLLTEVLDISEKLESDQVPGISSQARAVCKILLKHLLERLSNDVIAFHLVDAIVMNLKRPPCHFCKRSNGTKNMVCVLVERLMKHVSLESCLANALELSLLAIQKQCFLLAAHDTPVNSKPVKKRVTCSESKINFSLSCACADVMNQFQTSNPLACLIDYCQIILKHSFACITGKPVSRHFWVRVESQVTYQDAVRIHKSSMGLFLWNTLNALLPLAEIILLADSLVGPVAGLCRLLASLKHVPVQVPFHNSARLWFEDLTRTAVALSGTMAATLMTNHQHAMRQTKFDSKVKALMADFCNRGFKLTWLCELVQQGIVPMDSSATSPASSASHMLLGVDRAACTCINSSGIRFVDSIVAGRGTGDRLCRWLRESYANCDASYLIILQQASASGNRNIIWDIEKAAAALLMKYNHYESQASLYATRASAFRRLLPAPPRRFLYIWSGVARLTAWSWHCRSATSGTEPEDRKKNLGRVLSHLIFLLTFQNSDLHPRSRTNDWAAAKKSNRLRRAFVHARIAMRWALLSQEARPRNYCVRSTSKAMIFFQSCLVSNSNGVNCWSSLKHCVLCTVVELYHYTGLRESGVEVLCHLVGSLPASSLLLCALYPLPALFKSLDSQLRQCWTGSFSHGSLAGAYNKIHQALCPLMQQTVSSACASACSSCDAKVLLLLLATDAHVCQELEHILGKPVAVHADLTRHKILMYSMNQCSRFPLESHQNESGREKIYQQLFNAAWALLRKSGVAVTFSALKSQSVLFSKAGSMHLVPLRRTISCIFTLYAELAWHSLLKLTKQNTVQSNVPHPQLDSNQRRCQEIISAPLQLVNMGPGTAVRPNNTMSNTQGIDFSFTFWLFVSENATGYQRTVLVRGVKRFLWPIVLLSDSSMHLEIGFSTGATLEMERFISKDVIPLHSWVHIGLVVEGNKVKLYFDGKLNHQHVCRSHVSDVTALPLFVGRPPDCTADGFDGYVAHLRYYTRALSPIHLRIVCDQGFPSTFQAGDIWCYQLVSVLLVTTSVKECCDQLRVFHWLEILQECLKKGTSRIQQTSIRILQRILPGIDPAYCNSLSSPSRSGTTDNILFQSLFECIGLAVRHDFTEKGSFCNTLSVTSELITLFRHLLTIERWRARLFLLLKLMLETYISERRVSEASDSKALCHQLVALSLMGGYSSGIKQGTIASLSDGGHLVEVVRYDYLSGRALVVFCDCDTIFPTLVKQKNTFFQPFHIAADKLSAPLDQPDTSHGWSAQLLRSNFSTSKACIFPLLLNILDTHLLSLTARPNHFKTCDNDFMCGSFSRMQTQGQCVKALHALSLDPELLRTAVRWPRAVYFLARLSLEVRSKYSLTTLSDMESHVAFLRQRLHQVVCKRSAIFHDIGAYSYLADELRGLSSLKLLHLHRGTNNAKFHAEQTDGCVFENHDLLITTSICQFQKTTEWPDYVNAKANETKLLSATTHQGLAMPISWDIYAGCFKCPQRYFRDGFKQNTR